MNCKNCGFPLALGAEVCENCGTPVDTVQAEEAVHTPIAEQAEIPAEMQKEAPAEMPEEPADDVPQIVLNTAVETTKKKWGLKAVLIGAGVLLLALVVLLALNFGSITRWFLLNFGSADEIFRTVQHQSIDDGAAALSKAYESAYKSTKTDKTHISTEMHIKLGKIFLSSLEGTTDSNGNEIDMSWLEDILLQVDANYRPEGYSAKMGFGFGDQVVLTLDMLADFAAGRQYVAVPELNEKYIYMDSELDSMINAGMIAGVLPEPAVMEELLKRYPAIVLDHFCDVSRSEETVYVGEMEKKAVVLTAWMHEKAVVEMMIEFLQTAREDQAVKSMVDALGELQAANDPTFSAEEFYSQFQKEIDELLAEGTAVLETATTDESLYWVLYLDAKSGATLGQRLVNQNGEVALEVMTLTDKNDVVSRITLSNVELFVEATVEDGLISGKATLFAEGEEALKLDFEDFNVLKNEGTIGIQLGEAVLGGDMAMAALRLEIGIQGEHAGEVKITMAGLVVATVTIEETELKSEPITFPKDALDGNNELSIYSWLATMKYDTLLNNLQQAGISEELIQDFLEGFMQGLAKSLGGSILL